MDASGQRQDAHSSVAMVRGSPRAARHACRQHAFGYNRRPFSRRPDTMSQPTWHYENFEPAGSAIGYRITRKLDEVQSDFQKIEIYETTDWGNLMLIDGAVMLT